MTLATASLVKPEVFYQREDLLSFVKKSRKENRIIGLVPTMGSLHKGHLSLVEEIAKVADTVIVSVFANPTQFGAHEDFDSYPRNLESDLAKLSKTPARCVYAPSIKTMYDEMHSTFIQVKGLGQVLEGVHRPGHFEGVATIVAKLILQTGAQLAIFGEKDFQQLALVRRMVKDLDIPCTILSGALIRDKEGLALSSRNAYLTPDQKAIAIQFNQILSRLTKTARQTPDLRQLENTTRQALLDVGFDAVDYISVVHQETLVPFDSLLGKDPECPARVVATVRLGQIRLLDTMPIP